MQTTFVGPAIDDDEILDRIPAYVASSLRQQNGYIGANGGFHVRGACVTPDWHSLRTAWDGEYALHNLYPDVRPSDIPLAEDCLADQYLIREDLVIRLVGETGEIEPMECDWMAFLRNVEADPTAYLHLGFFQRFLEQAGTLAPGCLIHAYPPFVTLEGSNPSLKAIPALEVRAAHADFARQIRDVPDGGKIKIQIR